MRINRRLAINLIAVLLLGLLMVGWVVTQVLGSGVFTQPVRVTAEFANTGGVFTNQEVTYRGVLVGRVGDLSLSEDGVTVELLIDSEWEDRIPADVIANVRSKSAVGEQFVNLTPVEGASTEMLADGDVIEREDTSLPVEFQELLKSLDSVLADIPVDQAGRVVDSLDEALGDSSEDMKVILESLGTLSETFAGVADEQKSLLDSSTEAGRAFLATKDNFAAAIKAADQVFAGLGDEPEELRNFFAQNDRLARSGIAFFGKHAKNLRQGIEELRDFTEFQKDNSNELIVKTLKYVPAFLKAVEDASVRWESPSGEKFYRIRIGVVYDNVESSWPCKYVRPFEYERFPHEREDREQVDPKKCEPSSKSAARSLVRALEAWAEANPLEAFRSITPVAAGDVEAGKDGFIWPLSGAISSTFGPRGDRNHDGIDIDGTTGDPVVASAGGTVVLAEYYAGYGNTVIVDHGNGMATLYAHLSGALVGSGDVLKQGDVLGLVGCTGSCTGDHLHFELRVNGVAVDPLPYLPGGALFGAGPPGAESDDEAHRDEVAQRR